MADLEANNMANNETRAALRQAIRDRASVKVVQHILEEAPEDDTRNGQLFPVIEFAIKERATAASRSDVSFHCARP